jgi:hypothetical protein
MTSSIRGSASRSSETAPCLESILVSGFDQILKLQSTLSALCERCDQAGEWDDLRYFFSLPYVHNKSPLLLLFADRPGLSLNTLSASDLVAAVLTFEYSPWNMHTRVFVSDDFSARRTMIAPPGLRAEIARCANRILFKKGAAISLISYRQSASSIDDIQAFFAPEDQTRLWTTRQREIFSYLKLEDTMDETMAKLGKRTRSHMRYYRRRAEKDFGCTFVPNATISKADFQRFNQNCTFATSEEMAATRFDAAGSTPNAFLAGIRDRDGNWLSLVGGNKNYDFIQVYWQMNLASLPNYSISTVMRSFLIEHEIACGTKKFFIEGGTPHPMRFYFAREIVTDIVVKRKDLYTAFLGMIAKSSVAKKTFLAEHINTTDISWKAW